MSFDLPPDLTAALARLSEGVSRRDLAGHAAAISGTYRSGGTSKPIVSRDDALAYALVRMPATFAAVAASFAAINEVRPNFAPVTLLDVGAGPGTATWAAARAFASLETFAMIDANPALRTLALDLTADHPHLAQTDYRQGHARDCLKTALNADLVVTSYVLNEIPVSEHAAFADQLMARTSDTLLVVEPGTPAGYERIIALRDRLIVAGLHVIAPCPHDNACPLVSPDWCHFAQRLPRSRDHKQIKGADVPFEDEKYSFVALSRHPAALPKARVLTRPDVAKAGISLKLCEASGVSTTTIPRRDKAGYAQLRKAAWGDALF